MRNNERLIQFFDIALHGRTRAKGITHNLATPRTLDALMLEFQQLRELNLARRKISTQSKLEYRLEDMEERHDSWVLLINVVDPQAAHPVTQKIGGDDSDRTVIELSDDRGLESSTHLVILKQRDRAHKHLVLYEKSTSVPFGRASSFLNHLCRLTAKRYLAEYSLPHPDGVAGKRINTYCSITFLGHPSDEFQTEVETGRLSDVRLVSDVW